MTIYTYYQWRCFKKEIFQLYTTKEIVKIINIVHISLYTLVDKLKYILLSVFNACRVSHSRFLEESCKIYAEMIII